MPDDDEQQTRGPRALWSGTISFGLVSIPVELYPATRTERFSLRTLSSEGRPLRREYFCPAHAEPVAGDQIVRGFEVGDGQYVVVTDEELEALAPEKSRDIDLRRFVPRHELPMTSFERAHFMAPNSDSNKAYRLLAHTLEQTDRVGIATFVMRGKEYLVAIVAEAGLLRAETLRFADEIRTPDDIGLPTPVEPSRERVRQLEQACQALRASELELKELEDDELRRAQALVEGKLQRRQDVIQAAPEQTDSGEGGAEIIDLFEVLKRSLQAAQTPADESIETKKPSAAASNDGAPTPHGKLRKTTGRASTSQRKASGSAQGTGKERPRKHEHSAHDAPIDNPEQWTKKALYDRAQELEIAGRSQMTKPQLAKAIRSASSSSARKAS